MPAPPELVSTVPSFRWASPRRATVVRLAVGTAGAIALVALLALPVSVGFGGSPSAAPVPRFSAAHVTLESRPAANSTPFNPPCYKIDTTVCITIANQNETNIIPPVGTFVSSQEPNTTTDLILIIKSHSVLNWSASAPHYGPLSPISLNVTGVLWNGDPYYTTLDGSTWHSNNPNTWWGNLPYVPQNLTYPYQYTVTFSARSSNGAPNFYPGMTVKWWIYLTYNVSVNATSQYIHHLSPTFQFTYAGAWPFSPYPGSSQFAGASAAGEDLNLTVAPRQPNYNDSVKVTLNTTQADVLTNATIGANTYLDLTVTAPNGTEIGATTIAFPVNVQGGFGAVTTTITIPASYAQIEGATVTYWLAIRDVANDLLTLSPSTYVVGGNGTFLSGVFTDDIELDTSPGTVAAEPVGFAELTPGQPLNLTLLSRNPGTSISAAEVVYTVDYPLLHESVVLRAAFVRESSTRFVGVIPGLPLASFVNFTVDAWDFSERLEISPGYGYYVPDLQTDIPAIPTNASFFYVFVYDNGTHTWVTGAKIQIVGFQGVYNTVTNSTIGVAYPNETGAPYAPLLVAANASYKIVVNDPWFVPVGGRPMNDVNATILVYHTMTARQTLYVGPTYTVLQEGNAVLFYLNATPPPPAYSPSVTSTGTGTIPLAAIVGLGAAFVVCFPVVLWWRQIRARKKEEERRVTL